MKLRSEVKVGIFAVITLAALYWGINFLRGQDLFNRYNKYYASYDQVSGVQKSSAIVVRGFKVGVVKNMNYDPSTSERIILEFSIRSKFHIPKDSKARIFSDGLMGGKAIEIVLGESATNLESGDTLHSEMDKGILEMAGSELEFFKKKLDAVVTSVTTTLGSLNVILTDNTNSVSATMSNIADMTGSLKNIVVSEEQTMRSLISNMNSLSAALSRSSGKIEGIVSNVGEFSDSLRRLQIPTIMNNLSDAVTDLNGIMEKVNSGEGSIGKLVNDQALYDSLVEASSNLSSLLEDVKEHPGRYVNISIFGRKNK